MATYHFAGRVKGVDFTKGVKIKVVPDVDFSVAYVKSDNLKLTFAVLVSEDGNGDAKTIGYSDSLEIVVAAEMKLQIEDAIRIASLRGRVKMEIELADSAGDISIGGENYKLKSVMYI